MKIRRIMLWAVRYWFGLATAAGYMNASSPLSQLPAEAHYPTLPAQFEQALQAAREKITDQDSDLEAVRKLARLYHANRLFKEARTCYRMIAAAPSGLTARDHYHLADIAQNEYDLDVTLRELREVLRIEPGYVPARLALAEALFKLGREDDAEKVYSTILATEANQPQAALGLARIELQRGNDVAAVQRLEQLMVAHPEAISGAALLAKILERRGETDRAIAMGQWSLQKPPPPLPDPWLDSLLADCFDIQRLSITFEEYFKTGRMDEALPLLDRLALLDPKGPITKMFSGFSHAKALQHITAVREYYEALGKGGDPEKISPLLVQSLLALGKVSEAATLMADYYRKTPNSIPIAKAYASVAIQQGDEKMGKELLGKVLMREPYLQSQNMELANILWTSGERDAAVKCLQRVATAYPKDVPSRALLGEYYLGKADPWSAIKSLEQASVHAPANSLVQQNLSVMLGTAYLQAGAAEAEKGHFVEAADFADKTIHLFPTELNAYAIKAAACVHLRQFGRAAEALEITASLQPDNPTIQLSLGDVLFQDGDAEMAHRHWLKALQLTAAADSELRNVLQQRLDGRITAETFK